MPKLIVPPIETRIARDDARGWSLYAKDARDDAPLYRLVKCLTDAPWIDGRRTLHAAFIIHEKRLSRGGDAWLMAQHAPALKTWIETQCAEWFDLDYVAETFGYGPEELAELLAAEKAKYRN